MDDGSDLPEDRFNALLGRALRREDRDRLAKVRTALGIRANDAVWDVMIALDYHLQLYSAVPKQLAAEREKLVAELGALRASVGAKRDRRAEDVGGSWRWEAGRVVLAWAGRAARRGRGGIRGDLHRRRLDYGRPGAASLGCRGAPRRGAGGAGRRASEQRRESHSSRLGRGIYALARAAEATATTAARISAHAVPSATPLKTSLG